MFANVLRAVSRVGWRLPLASGRVSSTVVRPLMASAFARPLMARACHHHTSRPQLSRIHLDANASHGLDETFNSAAYSGDYAVMERLVRTCMPETHDVLDGYLYWAAKLGRYKMVKMIVEEKGSTGININEALRGACAAGDLNLVNWALVHGATDYTAGLMEAARTGHANAVAMMIGLASTPQAGQLDVALGHACKGKHRITCDVLINYGAKVCWNCGNHAICTAPFGSANCDAFLTAKLE